MQREIISMQFLPFTAGELAHLEISRLATVPELQRQLILCGPTPPEMEEEDERRRIAYQRCKLVIIEKHGVADAYLKPLLAEEEQLLVALNQLQQEIAALQAIQKM